MVGAIKRREISRWENRGTDVGVKRVEGTTIGRDRVVGRKAEEGGDGGKEGGKEGERKRENKWEGPILELADNIAYTLGLRKSSRPIMVTIVVMVMAATRN
jgi:hypothetical protein